MIPVELKVKGLYSYKETQSISFEKLTASQLFGIFGSVGCGKSSILEAIMFVLYDRSDRLNKSGDNRYYNMLNLQSDELEIDFVFRSQDREDTRYRFSFSAKRKKNDFEKVEVQERCQYRWENDQWIPIDVPDASAILGMNYENFMQAVIIPQGKFREFIDQKPVARTQMLKELFHLEKFDLGAKTGSLLKKAELKITDIRARLAEIGRVSEEEIEMHEGELKELEESLHQNRRLLDQLENECQQLEQLKKLFKEIENTQQQWHRLQSQSDFYEQKEQQLNAYVKACTHFNEKLKCWSETLMEKRKWSEELASLHERIAIGQKKLKEAEVHLHEKQKAYAQRDHDQLKCDDLERVIHIRSLQDDLNKMEHYVKEETQTVEALADYLHQHKEALFQNQTHLASLDLQLGQQKSLNEVFYWHQTCQHITQELNNHRQSLSRYQQQMKVILERKTSLLTSYEWARENGSFDKFYHLLEKQRTKLKASQSEVREYLRDLQVKEKLANYAVQLKNGSPCPLCGSTHHPAVTQVHSVGQEIMEQRSKIEALEKEEDQLLRLEQAVRALEGEYQSASSVFQDKEVLIKSVEEKQEKHQSIFVWDDYRQKTYEEIRQGVHQYEKQQQQAFQYKELLTQLRQQYDQKEEKWKQAQGKLQQCKDEYIKLKTTYDNQMASLRVLQYEKLHKFTVDNLLESLQKGRQRLIQVQNEYEAAQKNSAEIDRALGILEGKKETVEITLQELTDKAEILDHEIQALCAEKKFDNVQQVKDLLALELDTDAEHQEILTYKNQLHNTEVTLHKLKAEVQGKTYDEPAHRQALHACQELKMEVQKLQESCTLTRKHIADMQEKLKKSRNLQAALDQAVVREANLKELASLFRGSGFVNYASTVLLDNLCRAANERFMKLTKNNLSLELNENNEFIVRDYLNNGRTRLLKTLSGGQTFQAALCLALALAENVKSLNQAQQSFFFLDEGFGSLDKESLRIVFDTLKSLRKEKRVVGIISHVEELQQEIDVYLTIENDKERGSIVHCSWE